MMRKQSSCLMSVRASTRSGRNPLSRQSAHLTYTLSRFSPAPPLKLLAVEAAARSFLKDILDEDVLLGELCRHHTANDRR